MTTMSHTNPIELRAGGCFRLNLPRDCQETYPNPGTDCSRDWRFWSRAGQTL